VGSKIGEENAPTRGKRIKRKIVRRRGKPFCHQGKMSVNQLDTERLKHFRERRKRPTLQKGRKNSCKTEKGVWKD